MRLNRLFSGVLIASSLSMAESRFGARSLLRSQLTFTLFHSQACSTPTKDNKFR